VSSEKQLCSWRTSLGFPCSGAGRVWWRSLVASVLRAKLDLRLAGPGAVENRSGARVR
jgi:hypothetical protein